MFKIRLFFYSICLVIFSCNSSINEETILGSDEYIKLSVDYQISYQIESYNEINDLILFVEDYLNTESYNNMLFFWERSGEEKLTIAIDQLNRDIKSLYPSYKPTLYAIEVLENNHFLLKVAVIGNPEEFSSIHSIYNLKVKYDKNNNCYEFINTTNKLLESKNVIKRNNVTYYTNKDELSIDETNLSFEFERKLASFLSMDILSYNMVVFNDAKELNAFLGYDYEHSMYLNDGYAGLYIPYDNFILNGNGSAFYPHEVTHLYTKNKIGVKNNLIDEGFSTFLGGSLGYDYAYHVKNLKDYVLANNIKILEYLQDEEMYNILVGKSTSFKYSAGAFLCHLIYQNEGKEGLLKFLETGKTNADLIKNIEFLIGSSGQELENFLAHELKNFDKKINVLKK